MVARRVCCAIALCCFAACSFPEYRTLDTPGPNPSTGDCHNGVRDGDEAGIDCGPSCDACPVCSDGMLNGDETGVDCGGKCGPCPTCTDQTQNGNESDIDCGGTCQTRCSTDQRCREGTDCISLSCSNNVCQPPSCNDDLRNGHETGVDCGGDCTGCSNGSACTIDKDCKSLRCQGQVCVDAGCTDQVQNQSESDVDCGGMDCAPCGADMKCKTDDDCQSRVCTSLKCTAATCDDQVKNQDETDIDCGGASCEPCPIGWNCAKPSDCETSLCQSATCVPQNASGQPLARNKWVLTSSASDTDTGNAEPFDGEVATVWTSGTQQAANMYLQVDLGESKIFFKALMQTTVAPYDQDFPVMLNVYVSTDGQFGDPVMMNIQGNQWTWVDFPSAQVGRYIRFELTKPASKPWSVGELNLYN